MGGWKRVGFASGSKAYGNFSVKFLPKGISMIGYWRPLAGGQDHLLVDR